MLHDAEKIRHWLANSLVLELLDLWLQRQVNSRPKKLLQITNFCVLLLANSASCSHCYLLFHFL